MQDMLIQRYLGNKSPIAQDIVEVVKGLAKPGDLIFDAFSGSLAVSSALRKAGFKVACNDINHFSWLFAQAYFTSSELPWPNNKLGNPHKPPPLTVQQQLDIIIASSPSQSSSPL